MIKTIILAALVIIGTGGSISAQSVSNADGTIIINSDGSIQEPSFNEKRAQQAADFLYDRIGLSRAQYFEVYDIILNHLNINGISSDGGIRRFGDLKKSLSASLSRNQVNLLDSYENELDNVIRNGYNGNSSNSNSNSSSNPGDTTRTDSTESRRDSTDSRRDSTERRDSDDDNDDSRRRRGRGSDDDDDDDRDDSGKRRNRGRR